MILLAFSLLDWSGAQAVTSQTPEERVRSILAEQLKDVDEASRQRYANDLTAALRAASAAQSSRILSNLDQAVRYHAAQVERLQRKYRSVGLPAGLVREGYDLEFQYLAQRVLRAGRNEWTPDARSAAVRQIDALAEAMESTLRERIRGDAGADHVAREVGRLRKAWTDSLELPLNRFLDAPLPPEHLEVVKASLKEKATRFVPVELTAADASNAQRLAELGILKLIEEVVQAGYGATQYCFAELRTPEGQCRDWKARVEAQFGVARKGARLEEWAKEQAEPLIAPGEPDPKPNSTTRPKVTGAPPPNPSAPSLGKKDSAPAPKEDEAPRRSRTIVFLLLLAAAVLAWPIYRILKPR